MGNRYCVKYDKILMNGFNRIQFLIDDRKVWLPRKEITVWEQYSQVELPEWLLIEEGLEAYAYEYTEQD